MCSRELFIVGSRLESRFMTVPCCRHVGIAVNVDITSNDGGVGCDLYTAYYLLQVYVATKKFTKFNTFERAYCRLNIEYFHFALLWWGLVPVPQPCRSQPCQQEKEGLGVIWFLFGIDKH